MNDQADTTPEAERAYLRPGAAALAGKSPPHDIGAERAVLAAGMLDQEALNTAASMLEPRHFYAEQHATIWRALLQLHAEGKLVDVVLVAARLRLAGVGVAYLGDLLDATPHVGHVEQHARIVLNNYRQRAALAVAHRIVAEGYAQHEDAGAWIDEVVADLAGAGSDVQAADGPAWITASDMAGDLPPVQWVCEGLGLAPGRPNLLFGATGSVKTLLAQCIALSVASGKRLLGQWGVRPGVVAHLDYDQGRGASIRRYQRLACAAGVRLDELGSDLRLLSPPPMLLTAPSVEAWLERHLQGVDLCVLDSLIAAAPGVDENDARIAQFVHTLWRVSQTTGCTVLLLHHSGKQTPGVDRDPRDRARGSSAIMGAAGCALELSGKSGEPRLLRCAKASVEGGGSMFDACFVEPRSVRIGDDPEAGLELVYVAAEDIKVSDGAAAKFLKLRERVLKLVKANPGLPSLTAIANRLDGAQKQAKLDAVRELIAEGALVSVNGGFRVA